MVSRSLGTAPNSKGDGLTPANHRWVLSALFPNTGIIEGCRVVLGSGLTYRIENGVGVTMRSGSDGKRIFTFAAANVGPVSPTTSLPRIDTLWVKALDPLLDNDSVDVIGGVTQGVPSNNPIPPTIPADCTRINDVYVRANTTNLSTGAYIYGSYDYVIPYGSTMGLLGRYIETTPEIREAAVVRKWYTKYGVSFHIPTDRIIEVTFDSDVSYEGPGGIVGCMWASTFQIDGRDVPNSSRETYVLAGHWTHCTNSLITTVGGPGQHSVSIRYGVASRDDNVSGAYIYSRYGDNQGLTYPGRTVRIWDRGPAR